MGALSLYALPLSAVCLTIPCAFTHKSVNPLRAQPLRAHPLLISVIPSLPTPMLATTQARRGALVHETLVRSPLRPSAYARALSLHMYVSSHMLPFQTGPVAAMNVWRRGPHAES